MNLAKAIGVGALGLLAISGLTLWNNIKNKRPPPSKQQTLEILQAVRQQFYPILIKIATKVTKQLAPRGLTPAQNQAIIINDPYIKEEIEKINNKIYEKFSEDDIKEAVETEFKDDEDIQHQKKQFQQEYKKSMMGVMPQRQMVISRKLRKDKVLKAVKSILQDKVDRLKVQIGNKFDQKQIGQFLESDVEEDQRVTKQIIKKELGLCAKDSVKIFHFTVVQYKQDPQFLKKYEQITANYNKRIQDLIPS